MFAVDAGLWELNRVLAVTCRRCGSCQNEAIVKLAIQNVSIQHEVQNIAREASAAPAASFKSANQSYTGLVPLSGNGTIPEAACAN